MLKNGQWWLYNDDDDQWRWMIGGWQIIINDGESSLMMVDVCQWCLMMLSNDQWWPMTLCCFFDKWPSSAVFFFFFFGKYPTHHLILELKSPYSQVKQISINIWYLVYPIAWAWSQMWKPGISADNAQRNHYFFALQLIWEVTQSEVWLSPRHNFSVWEPTPNTIRETRVFGSFWMFTVYCWLHWLEQFWATGAGDSLLLPANLNEP